MIILGSDTSSVAENSDNRSHDEYIETNNNNLMNSYEDLSCNKVDTQSNTFDLQGENDGIENNNEDTENRNEDNQENNENSEKENENIQENKRTLTFIKFGKNSGMLAFALAGIIVRNSRQQLLPLLWD